MKTRIISAAIAIPFGVLVIVFDNAFLYSITVSLISATAVFELLSTAKYMTHKDISVISIVYAFCMPIAFIVDVLIDYKFLFALAYLFVMFFILIIKNKRIPFEKIATAAFFSIFIPFSLTCVLFSKKDFGIHGTFVILFILLSSWVGDAGAYFVGTFFGRHKMAPDISPKKTWEGFAGGIIASGIVIAFLSYGYETYNNMFSFTEAFSVNILYVLMVAVISSALGVVGDFSASVLKRQFMVKDFGNVMPGHGGVLDRFDSVLFAAPFVYFVFRIYFPVITIA